MLGSTIDDRIMPSGFVTWANRAGEARFHAFVQTLY
jgi:hypothetical protein